MEITKDVAAQAAAIIRGALAFWGGDSTKHPPAGSFGGTHRNDACAMLALNRAAGASINTTSWSADDKSIRADIDPATPLAAARRAIVMLAPVAAVTGMNVDEQLSKYTGAHYMPICNINNSLSFEELTAVMDKAATQLEAQAA